MASAGLASPSGLRPSRAFLCCCATEPLCDVLDPEFRVVSGWESSRPCAFFRGPVASCLGEGLVGATWPPRANPAAAPSRPPCDPDVSGHSSSRGKCPRGSCVEGLWPRLVSADGAGFARVGGSGCGAAAGPPPGAHGLRGGAREPRPRVDAGGGPWRPRRRRAPPRPGRRGRPGPLGTSCVRGKMAARGPVQGAQNGGRGGPGERAGESPAQREGPFPPRPLLPVTPSCARHRPGSSVSWSLEQGCLSLGEGTLGEGDGVSPHLVGGDKSWASLALDVILLGICPFEFSSWLVLKLVGRWLKDSPSSQFRCRENQR